jgi:hypothetical protein
MRSRVSAPTHLFGNKKTAKRQPHDGRNRLTKVFGLFF